MNHVINQASLSEHSIDRYKFKVLSNTTINEHNGIDSDNTSMLAADEAHEVKSNISSKDELVESLLKKTDEMTSNFIKLQMKLEKKDEECKQQQERIKQESFEEGKIAGQEEFNAKIKEEYDETHKRFEDSILKMQKSAQEYEGALDAIKHDLLRGALDIAKEVVGIELENNSSNVAKALADELIGQLQNAGKMTIKVNPIDYQVILEKLGSNDKIEVVPDTAISKGGVVIMSDVGNMDAQILNRFDRVKKVVLDGK